MVPERSRLDPASRGWDEVDAADVLAQVRYGEDEVAELTAEMVSSCLADGLGTWAVELADALVDRGFQMDVTSTADDATAVRRMRPWVGPRLRPLVTRSGDGAADRERRRSRGRWSSWPTRWSPTSTSSSCSTLLTDRCVEVLGVAAAGLMLVGARWRPAGHGVLERGRCGSSSCSSCRPRRARASTASAPASRWRRTTWRRRPIAGRASAAEALASGFRAVHALPLRLRDSVIGALNLFHVETGPMAPADIEAAQALADVATIAILQHRATHEAQVLAEQLSHALNSRIVIEQAKGMVAERETVPMEEAFARLRRHARDHNRRLADVAERRHRRAARGVRPQPRSW